MTKRGKDTMYASNEVDGREDEPMNERQAEEPIPVAALLVDPKTSTVQWANKVALEWLRSDEDDVVGRRVSEIIPIAGAIGMSDDMRYVASTGEPRHERSFVMAAGERHTFTGSIYLLPDGHLLVLAMVA
jgi:hypothetical protein